jgi:hypothetical protein
MTVDNSAEIKAAVLSLATEITKYHSVSQLFEGFSTLLAMENEGTFDGFSAESLDQACGMYVDLIKQRPTADIVEYLKTVL